MKKLLVVAVAMAFSSIAYANTFTIDFEQYTEFTQITNQYSAQDATFTNALQLVAPDYDYFDFPPHSGSGVISNDPNDPIVVDFTAPVSFVTGWYADPFGVTVTAFDFDGNVIDVFNGGAVDGSNLEFSVDGGLISSITISDVGGSPDDETVDDLSYAIAPEPSAFLLLGTGLLVLAGVLRRKRRPAICQTHS
jgi:PEP-CTERM motif